MLNVDVQVCELVFNDKGEVIEYILQGYNKLFEQLLNLTRRNLARTAERSRDAHGPTL